MSGILLTDDISYELLRLRERRRGAINKNDFDQMRIQISREYCLRKFLSSRLFLRGLPRKRLRTVRLSQARVTNSVAFRLAIPRF